MRTREAEFSFPGRELGTSFSSFWKPCFQGFNCFLKLKVWPPKESELPDSGLQGLGCSSCILKDTA